MNKLSKETQNYLDNIPVEESPFSADEKDSLLHLVMRKVDAAEAPEADRVAPAAQPRRRIRPAYLIAAVVAALGLLGAGYATSVYFHRMYRLVDIPYGEQYDQVADDPDSLVEPPVFEGDSGGITVLELEYLGHRYLGPVFEGRRPGELFDVELIGPRQKLKGQALAGNALNLLIDVNDQGVPGASLVLSQSQAPSPQQVIDRAAADGDFLVSLDHPDYTPKFVEYHYAATAIVYENERGDSLSLALGRTLGPIPISQELMETATVEEFERNGNRFVMLCMGETANWLSLYLGDHREVFTSDVPIAYSGTKEHLLELAEAVTVHNPLANSLIPFDEAFFTGLPHPGIRTVAGEIAAAYAAAVPERSGPEAVVWERDGVTVTKPDAEGVYAYITVPEGLENGSGLYPYRIHTSLVDQSWFPQEQFASLYVMYENTRPVNAFYQSADGRYGLGASICENRNAATPLDAVLAGLRDQQLTIHRVINPRSDTPLVVVSYPESDRISVHTAVKTADGPFLTETLTMPRDELPTELMGD